MIPDFKTVEDRSRWIISHADMFTAVRFHGRGKYERHEFKNLFEAEAAAKQLAEDTGGRYLIYACAGPYDSFIRYIQRRRDDAPVRQHSSL